MSLRAESGDGGVPPRRDSKSGAIAIGQIRGEGIPAARKLHIFGVDVRAVEGGRGRWKAVKVGQSEQQPRQCDSPAAYLHRPPPPCTALHRIRFHLSLPFAYTQIG